MIFVMLTPRSWRFGHPKSMNCFSFLKGGGVGFNYFGIAVPKRSGEHSSVLVADQIFVVFPLQWGCVHMRGYKTLAPILSDHVFLIIKTGSLVGENNKYSVQVPIVVLITVDIWCRASVTVWPSYHMALVPPTLTIWILNVTDTVK